MGNYRQDGAYVDRVHRVKETRRSRAGVEYVSYKDIGSRVSTQPRLSNPWGNGQYMAPMTKRVLVLSKEGVEIQKQLGELMKERIRAIKTYKSQSRLEKKLIKLDEEYIPLWNSMFKSYPRNNVCLSYYIKPTCLKSIKVPV